MKTILNAGILILSLFASLNLRAQNSTATNENPAHQELRQLRDGLLDALNKGDLEATLKYSHTNCVITWHNAKVSRGHDGVRAYADRVMKGPNRYVESFQCSIHVDELTSLYGE